MKLFLGSIPEQFTESEKDIMRVVREDEVKWLLDFKQKVCKVQK